MSKIYISNKDLENIVNNFDTDLIDWDKSIQEFELESIFINLHQNGEVDVKVVVDTITTNNTTEVESIRFDDFTGFIAGSSDDVVVEFDESYLEKLENDLKSRINGY